MPYRPSVYNANGDLIFGSWKNANNEVLSDESDWNETYFNFEVEGNAPATNYVYVQYNQDLIGGSGPLDIIDRIYKFEINGKDSSFFSLDDRVKPDYIKVGRSIDIVKNDIVQTKYSAYDQVDLCAARVVKYTVKTSEIDNENKYVIPDDDFNGRKVIGLIECNKKINNIEKNAQGNIVLVFDKKEDSEITIALDGHILTYNDNSRTAASSFYVAKTIKYVLTEKIDRDTIVNIPARNDQENIGIVKCFLETKHRASTTINDTYQTFSSANVFVKKKEELPKLETMHVVSIESIGTPVISILFSEELEKDTVVEIPVLLTYQPTQDDIVDIYYTHTPYQGIVDTLSITNNSVAKLQRISDWKMFSAVLGSSYFFEDVFNNTLRPKNSILNTIDRLPGGLLNSNKVHNDKKIDFVAETITQQNNFNNYIRFHDKFSNVLSYTNTYEEILSDFIKDVVIEKKDNNLYLKVGGFQGLDIKQPINKYDGAACLVSDDRGSIYMLIMGGVDVFPTVQTKVDSSFFDLFRLEDAPLLKPRKMSTSDFDLSLIEPPNVIKLPKITGLRNIHSAHNLFGFKWDYDDEQYPNVKYEVHLFSNSDTPIYVFSPTDVNIYQIKNNVPSSEVVISPNTEYKVRIRVIDSAGNTSDLSEPLTCKTTSNPNEFQDSEPPNPPTDLQVVQNVPMSNDKVEVTISWKEPKDNVGVQKYKIYYRKKIEADDLTQEVMTQSYTVSITGTAQITELSITLPQRSGHSDNTVTYSGTSVANLVTAINNGGIYSVTSSGATYINLTTSHILKDANTSATIAPNTLQISIQDNTVKTYPNFTKTITEATIKNLETETDYVFRVTAIDWKNNESEKSEELLVLTNINGSQDTTPPTPGAIRVLSRTVNSVTLGWDQFTDNTKIVQYQVINTSNSNQVVVTLLENNNGTSPNIKYIPPNNVYTVTGLSATTTYTFRIKGYDAGNNFAQTNQIQVTTRSSSDTSNGVFATTTKPGKPYISSVTNKSFTVSWTPPPNNTIDVAYYHVIVNGATYTTVGSETTYTINHTSANHTNYNISVKPFSTYGETTNNNNPSDLLTISRILTTKVRLTVPETIKQNKKIELKATLSFEDGSKAAYRTIKFEAYEGSGNNGTWKLIDSVQTVLSTNNEAVATTYWTPPNNLFTKIRARYEGNIYSVYLASSDVKEFGETQKIKQKTTSSYEPTTSFITSKVVAANTNKVEQVASLLNISLPTSIEIEIDKIEIAVAGGQAFGQTKALPCKIRGAIWDINGNIVATAPDKIFPPENNVSSITYKDLGFSKVKLKPNTNYLIGFWRSHTDNNYTTAWVIDPTSTTSLTYYEDNEASSSGVDTFHKNVVFPNATLKFKVTYSYWTTNT